MNKVLYRRAALKDCRGIAQVQVDSYRTAYAGIFPPSYLDRISYEEQAGDWQSLLSEPTGDILLAATLDEQVVGYVLARAHPDIYPGFDAEIVAIHVRQSHQRKGIGRALLTAAVEKMADQGCASVMLWALEGNPIRRWYERLGGQRLGEKRFQVDGWEIVEVAYGWGRISALLPKELPELGTIISPAENGPSD